MKKTIITDVTSKEQLQEIILQTCKDNPGKIVTAATTFGLATRIYVYDRLSVPTAGIRLKPSRKTVASGEMAKSFNRLRHGLLSTIFARYQDKEHKMRNTSKLDQLDIVASYKIMRSEIDYKTDKIKLIEVSQCLYTPKAINQALKQHNLTEATWIIGPADKELWIAKGELAKKL